MPYAEGIEHINENTDSLIKILLNKPNLFLKNVWFNICALLQKLSIDNCDSITTFNLHNFSLKTFENLGVKPSLIPLFTFYHKEHIPKFDKKKFKKIFKHVWYSKKFNYFIFSCCSLLEKTSLFKLYGRYWEKKRYYN